MLPGMTSCCHKYVQNIPKFGHIYHETYLLVTLSESWSQLEKAGHLTLIMKYTWKQLVTLREIWSQLVTAEYIYFLLLHLAKRQV